MSIAHGRLPPGIELRPTRDSDSAGWIALIGAVFEEYPGCVLDVETEEPELLFPASSFERAWVLVAHGAASGERDAGERVVGTVALATRARESGLDVELKKCYLAAELRGQGLGKVLVETVEEAARGAGAERVVLWSDTRFELAHAVYERLGYARTGATRELHDLADTTEYEFVKPLR